MTAGAHKLSLRGGHATSVVIPRLRCEHWGTRGPAPAALVRTGEKPASIDISISRPSKRGRLATSGAPSLPAYVAPWLLRLRPGRNAVPGGHARRARAAARRFQGPADTEGRSMWPPRPEEVRQSLRFGLSLLSAFVYSSVRCSSSVGCCFQVAYDDTYDHICTHTRIYSPRVFSETALDHYMFDPIR